MRKFNLAPFITQLSPYFHKLALMSKTLALKNADPRTVCILFITFLNITLFIHNVQFYKTPTKKSSSNSNLQTIFSNTDTKNTIAEYTIHPTEFPECRELYQGDFNNLSLEENKAFTLFNLQHQPNLSGFLNFSSEIQNSDFVNSKISPKSESSICTKLLESRKYFTKALSTEEANFPIAYSIVIHKNLEMFERQFRAIYQPQNFYCIHLDAKSTPEFQQQIKNFVSCFGDNVIEPQRHEKVYYAHYSRVMADMHCLHALQKFNYKYIFNLCGQDFPIKTNLEIVRDLKSLNGRDECESVDITSTGKLGRVLKGYRLNTSVENYGNTLIRDEKLDKPWSKFGPLGRDTGLFAGSAYFLLSKKSVDFIQTDKTVREFFAWSQNSWSPDEHIWATLFRYAALPGSVPSHEKYEMNEAHARTRLVKWYGLDRKKDEKIDGNDKLVHNVALYEPCHGKWQRGTCVYGALDLKFLRDSKHWFANKFDQEVDAIAVDCLDVVLRTRALQQAAEYL